MANQPTIQQTKANNKVYDLRRDMNDNELSKTVGVAKMTLYKRLKLENWTDKEILFIEYKHNKEFNDYVNSLNIL